MDLSHAIRMIVARPFALSATGLAVLNYGSFDHFRAGLTAGVMANEIARLAAALTFDRIDQRTIFFIYAIPASHVSVPS